MVFNSLSYLIFLSFFVLCFWTIPANKRIYSLIFFSIAFYCSWKAEYLLLLLTSITIDYFLAILISNAESKKLRRFFLTFSIFLNIAILFYFKYFNFFIQNSIESLKIFNISIDVNLPDILLPLAISFYTFEAISYIIDVYNKTIPPEKNFLKYAGFILFFPKLIAGPVLRPAEILPQLDAFNNRFDTDLFAQGIRSIIYGLFLKVVLADNIAPLVDSGFNQPPLTLSAIDVITLSFLFGYQIYFDFSGYSKIAIGSAQLVGISIQDNFNFPYTASSPREFWKKWHISLSKWIKDYLYIPLLKQNSHQTNDYREGLVSTIALFLTWGIMGLWHGANWTFLLWGLYHALLITLFRAFASIQKLNRLSHPIKIWGGRILTLPLIMISWIFFRANSTASAFEMLGKLKHFSNYEWLGLRENTYIVAFFLTIVMYISFVAHHYSPVFSEKFPHFFRLLEIVFLSIAIFLILVFLRPISQFIYFQF